ncbi:MAG: hypothetical protein V3R57_01455, partial [Candidatus Bathyarchaeia archaeon]
SFTRGIRRDLASGIAFGLYFILSYVSVTFYMSALRRLNLKYDPGVDFRFIVPRRRVPSSIRSSPHDFCPRQ